MKRLLCKIFPHNYELLSFTLAKDKNTTTLRCSRCKLKTEVDHLRDGQVISAATIEKLYEDLYKKSWDEGPV